MNKIIIDIGHGVDTYPPSKGVGDFAEHTFNSKVGIKAKEILIKNGIDVVFSQKPFKKDTELKERVDIANKNNVDLFISIHANASKDKDASGYGVFYYKDAPKAKRLAKCLLYQSKNLGIPKWGEGLWESKPNTWSDFYVLRYTKMPAVLIEHFFYTNPKELKMCNTEEFIEKSAIHIAKAVLNYFGVDYDEEVSSWAEEARDWAIENNISDGTRPKENATREEIWTMLHRMRNL